MAALLRRLVALSLIASMCASAQVQPLGSRWAAEPWVYPPKVATPGSEAYLALLHVAGASARAGVLCGGSIVANGWIVTAAHCVFDDQCQKRGDTALGVRTGQSAIDRLDETSELISARIFHHPGFQCVPVQEQLRRLRAGEALPIGNDVALVLVPKVKKSGGPRLATQEAAQAIQPGTGLRALGWGRISATQYAATLQEVNLEMSDVQACATAWKPSSLAVDSICGGRTQVDPSAGSCMGDSGGPVVGQFAGRTVQFGVVSTGNQVCGQMTRPSIFTSIGVHQQWIEEVAGKAVFDSTPACAPPTC